LSVVFPKTYCHILVKGLLSLKVYNVGFKLPTLSNYLFQ
jgi:hypothetical protein